MPRIHLIGTHQVSLFEALVLCTAVHNNFRGMYSSSPSDASISSTRHIVFSRAYKSPYLHTCSTFNIQTPISLQAYVNVSTACQCVWNGNEEGGNIRRNIRRRTHFSGRSNLYLSSGEALTSTEKHISFPGALASIIPLWSLSPLQHVTGVTSVLVYVFILQIP